MDLELIQLRHETIQKQAKWINGHLDRIFAKLDILKKNPYAPGYVENLDYTFQELKYFLDLGEHEKKEMEKFEKELNRLLE